MLSPKTDNPGVGGILFDRGESVKMLETSILFSKLAPRILPELRALLISEAPLYGTGVAEYERMAHRRPRT